MDDAGNSMHETKSGSPLLAEGQRAEAEPFLNRAEDAGKGGPAMDEADASRSRMNLDSSVLVEGWRVEAEPIVRTAVDGSEHRIIGADGVVDQAKGELGGVVPLARQSSEDRVCGLGVSYPRTAQGLGGHETEARPGPIQHPRERKQLLTLPLQSRRTRRGLALPL